MVLACHSEVSILNRIGRALLIFLILVLAAFTTIRFAAPSYAHGVGTPQVVNEDAGPYSISIWTDPNPLRADETHVVVAVVDPRTREPIVNDVGVAVRMRSVSDPTHEIVRQAPTDQTNRLLYAAEFTDLVAPGAWEVGVTASGPAGTTREVKFLVEITNASQPSYFLIGAAVMGGIVTIWLVTSARTSRKAPHIAAH